MDVETGQHHAVFDVAEYRDTLKSISFHLNYDTRPFLELLQTIVYIYTTFVERSSQDNNISIIKVFARNPLEKELGKVIAKSMKDDQAIPVQNVKTYRSWIQLHLN